jgi:hypothetical protein
VSHYDARQPQGAYGNGGVAQRVDSVNDDTSDEESPHRGKQEVAHVHQFVTATRAEPAAA